MTEAITFKKKVASASGSMYVNSSDLEAVDGNSIDTVAVNAASAANAPTDITLVPGNSFNESVAGAIVGVLSVTDPDPGDTHTFSVSDLRFEVVNNQLKLKDGIRLDYEREPQINLDVTATDTSNLSVTRTFAVAVGDVPEVRFAAFGDYGFHTASGLVANLVKNLNPDFVITLGDNVYNIAPIDDQIGRYYSDYIGNYKGAYGTGSATNRFFPALGNHEYSDPAGGVNASAYLDYFTLPGNERYYDYEVGPVHFFVVNSDAHEPDGRTSTSVQGKWLQAGLETSTSPYNIVYFHHPAFSSGHHGSTRAMQWPFEQWGATAVLNGHDHLYERILRDGNGDGTIMPYFVSGLGGASKYAFTDPPISGSAVQYNADWGTMLVQASEFSITFEFVSVAGGGTVVDSYTIDLAPNNGMPRLFSTGNDNIDFSTVLAGSYLAGSQYNAMAGDDTVMLPVDAAVASTAGYSPITTFHGDDGNDSIVGGGLDDSVAGDAGNDTLVGGSGTDQLSGGADHDTLKWDSIDAFNGGTGFDTLDANLASSDTIDLRGTRFASMERILTGDGSDTVTIALGKVLSDTADHQFIVDVGSGADILNIDLTGGWAATASNPALGATATAAGISVAGLTAYTYSNGTDTVTIFSDAETVRPFSLASLFTAGADVVDFNKVSSDTYLPGSQYNALAGNDTVTLPTDAAAAAAAGYSPAQPFHGGDGNDVVTGGSLSDQVYGDTGVDTLMGAAGNDRLFGGGSGDVLIAGAGNDAVDGGSSTDRVDYTTVGAAILVNLGLGTATGDGNDTLLNVENVTGSSFDDSISGSAGANTLLGGDGNDVLHGAAGNDNLTGGNGVDGLFGDDGHDVLKWDSADKLDGGLGFDTINANLSTADKIDLRGVGFTNVERIQTGGGKDTVTLSLNDVLLDASDNQFVADLGGSSPDTLNIDLSGGWIATASNPALGQTGTAAGVSVVGMTAYTFTNGADTVTVFSNAEVTSAQIMP